MSLALKIAKELSHLPTIKVSEIQNLQGNLKDLSEDSYKRLVARLEKVGFKYPLYLWKNPKDKKLYNLDGNQRERTIKQRWGESVELPYIEISAKNETEAKKEILAISSQYGEVNKDGFDEFTAEFELEDFKEMQMEMTFDKWIDKDSDFLDTTGMVSGNTGGGDGSHQPSSSDDDYSTFELIMLHENKLKFIDTLNKIKEVHLFDKMEDALMEMVNIYNKL